MAAKLRLQRMGSKKNPSYRIVLADSRAPRDGKFIKSVGVYDPKTDPPTVKADLDEVENLIAKGVQMTETVEKLLKRIGFRGKKTGQKIKTDTGEEAIAE